VNERLPGTQEHLEGSGADPGAGAVGAGARVSGTAARTGAVSADQKDDVRIGVRLRHARKLKGLRLKDLADAVGCSESFLSKVENEQVTPSLKTLHRLVAELGTTIGELFSVATGDHHVVMRRKDRPLVRTESVGRGASSGVFMECLIADPGSRLLYGSIHVVEPGCSSGGTIQHSGEEVGYVLEGVLNLQVDGITYLLETGDSFFFDSSLHHGYSNPGSVTTRIIWINTPPTF